MDQLNAHQLHGISPGLDLLAVSKACSGSTSGCGDAPLSLLQLAPYDPRHSVYTISRCARHTDYHAGPIHLYVYEEEPENLARHILLLSVLLDGRLLPKERMELFLELHSNALLRERGANYLDQRARELEAMLVSLSSKGDLPTASNNSSSGSKANSKTNDGSSGIPLLASLLDISLLKFQDRDRLVDAFKMCRRNVPFDMVKALDNRSRKWYGDRFDFRRNMVDWDYHMPLMQAGTPGIGPESGAAGSIIHYHHFRFWRMTGIAHELRDSHYNEANRSLVSQAIGRTKEFKDRSGKDVGRSVSAWGYWGDILNSPYHCFGTVSEDPSFFKIVNKQFGRTAVDVAEHNILSALHELRTGQPVTPSSSGEAHRARVARGPTSMADLEEDSKRTQEAQAAAKQQDQAAAEQQKQQPQQQQQQSQESHHQQDQQQSKQDQKGQDCLERHVQDKLHVSSPHATQALSPQTHRLGQNAAPSTSTCSCSGSDAAFVPCSAFQGPRPGYFFTTGGSGTGYYADGQQGCDAGRGGRGGKKEEEGPASTMDSEQPGQQGMEQQQRQSSGQCSSEQGVTSNEQHPQQQQQQQRQQQEGTQMQEGVQPQQDAKRQQMAHEEEALRKAEAALDAAMAEKIGGGRVRLIPILGSAIGGPQEFSKLLSGKSKLAGRFKLITVGHRHVHLLNQDYGVSKILAPGGHVVAESGKYMLQLNKEQAKAFTGKIDELAASSGLSRAQALEQQLQQPPPGSCSGMVLPDAHLLYAKGHE